jgi:hypothetical protein
VPQDAKRACRHRGAGRRAALPAALLAGPSGQCPEPIEQAFAKLKALVRAKAPRTLDELWDTIGTCLDRFTPAECANYLANSGYPRLM